MAPPPSFIEQAHALAAAGRAAEAVLLLNQRAGDGDPDALFTLGVWHLSGQVVPRNFRQSREYFRRSGEAGRADASAAFTAYVASGIGERPDWALALKLLQRSSALDMGAQQQLELLRRMDLDDQGNPRTLPDPEVLSSTPHVEFRPGLFTREECEYLVGAAQPLFQPSDVIHPVTGERLLHPVRRSDLAAFPLMAENPAIHALNRRLATISGTDAAQGEPLQVLRYGPGQEYKPHHDALPGEANQRIITVLVYLNDDYTGGETVFTNTGLSVKGKVGDALLFRNVTKDGRPDPMAQHAGCPVHKGTKLIASRWIRRETLDLGAPRY